MESLIARLPNAFLYFFAAVFIIYGVIGFLEPVSSVANMGIIIDNNHAKIEVRATYGGLLVGLGVLFAYSASRDSSVRFGLVAIICILTTVGLSRLYGIIVDGDNETIQWDFLIMELVGAVIAALILFLHPSLKGGS
ncbi:MAG: DUF4345 family protein [Moritella sp.]|uniref:DUF4345 family protein n=1 Tax=unclassified Moritella TaxID=2637987 RepID=UPI0005C525F2|nr:MULTISPECIES: DUF4345 family protein [unclassified Moritella]MBL1417877.1 DUF4345 family protein [Moritella sp.]